MKEVPSAIVTRTCVSLRDKSILLHTLSTILQFLKMIKVLMVNIL